MLGTWQIDLSPEDKSDNNFAMMRITKIDNKTFEGDFYRDGVEMRNAKINTQLDLIYGALISGDASGTYHSAFYYDNGVLHGTTHAINRNFLSVWTASKRK